MANRHGQKLCTLLRDPDFRRIVRTSKYFALSSSTHASIFVCWPTARHPTYTRSRMLFGSVSSKTCQAAPLSRRRKPCLRRKLPLCRYPRPIPSTPRSPLAIFMHPIRHRSTFLSRLSRPQLSSACMHHGAYSRMQQKTAILIQSASCTAPMRCFGPGTT